MSDARRSRRGNAATSVGAAQPTPEDEARGLLRIRSVARATGLSADTLRVWERRYGALASHRSAGGYRLYSDADLRRIRLLRALIAKGHAIGEIATLPIDELERRAGRDAEAPTKATSDALEATRARFLAAIDALDTPAAERAIAESRLVLPPLAWVRGVVLPLLREIGDRWASGALTVAHEHAASAVVRGHLGDVLRTLEAPLGAPLAIAATPEGEQHEFGALVAGIVAGLHGFRVIYLGASVPAADLARAAIDGGACVVLVSLVAIDAKAAARELGAIRRAVPRSIALFAGGPHLPTRSPPGVTPISDLDYELTRALATMHAGGTSGGERASGARHD